MLICSFELSSAFNLLDSLPLLLREPAGQPARNLLAHLLCPLSPHMLERLPASHSQVLPPLILWREGESVWSGNWAV